MSTPSYTARTGGGPWREGKSPTVIVTGVVAAVALRSVDVCERRGGGEEKRDEIRGSVLVRGRDGLKRRRCA